MSGLAPTGTASDPRPADVFVLRLFVAGTTPRSLRAVKQVKKICENYLAGRYDLEVIDIYERPDAVRQYQVIAAPTLIKVAPAPVRRMIGDLSDIDGVLRSLGVKST